MADNNKTPYELRWEILKEMINLTRDEWHHKRELAQYNAEKSGKFLFHRRNIHFTIYTNESKISIHIRLSLGK